MDSGRSSISDIEDVSIREFKGPDNGNNVPRRQSLIRRLSSAASSFTTAKDDEFNDSITGTASIYRALSHRSGSGSVTTGLQSRSGSVFDVLDNETVSDEVRIEADTEGQTGDVLSEKKEKVELRDFSHKWGVNYTVFSLGKKIGIWDDSLDKRFFILMMAAMKNYVILVLALLTFLSIYWGSYFNRSERFPNLHYPVYIADEGVPDEDIPPVVGEIVANFFTNVSVIKELGTFDIQNMTEFAELAASHNLTIEQEVNRQIYHEKSYGAFLIHKNATRVYFENLQGQGQLPKDTILEIVYETGRDYNILMTLIVPLMQNVNKVFIRYISQTPLWTILTEKLNDTQLTGLIANSPDILTSIPSFSRTDLHPIPSVIYQAPLILGVLYLCVFSFFQFLFMVPINQKVAQRIKGYKFILYRFFISQFAYVVISLSYVLLNTAYGMSYETTFGQSGFLVIWMFGYLVMSALGSTIEVLILLVVPDRIHLVGIILVGTIILNLAPTLSGMVFAPSFYKYGYAMPVYQAYKLMHVAYFNVWKGNVGRYIGILCVWIVLSNLLLPVVIVRTAKKIAALKQAAAAAADSSNTVDSSTKTQQPTEVTEKSSKNNIISDNVADSDD